MTTDEFVKRMDTIYAAAKHYASVEEKPTREWSDALLAYNRACRPQDAIAIIDVVKEMIKGLEVSLNCGLAMMRERDGWKHRAEVAEAALAVPYQTPPTVAPNDDLLAAVLDFGPDLWWAKELCKHWGEGHTSYDTRRAAKVACNLVDQLHCRTAKVDAQVPSPANFTVGHCLHKQAPGGCQLPNLQCGYPHCDRRRAPNA